MIDASLLIAAASLIISLLTFYRVEMRGPKISVTAPLANRQSDLTTNCVWTGAFPRPHVIMVRLLIVNEGPRSGLLESIIFSEPHFLPHRPRILRATVSGLGDPELKGELRPPVVVRDGDISVVTPIIEITTSSTEPDQRDQLAHDLLELTGVRLSYRYTSWRRSILGRLRTVETRGHVDIGLADVRNAALRAFTQHPFSESALAILSGPVEVQGST
jgi:hypothetical protein